MPVARIDSATAVKELKCFVVCERYDQCEPLFVAVEKDSSIAFRRAKAFLLGLNSLRRSSKAVLRRGTANLQWQTR